jgi:chemotaxis protein CheX
MEPSPSESSFPFAAKEIDVMVADSAEKVFSTMLSTSAKVFVAYNHGETPEKTHPRLNPADDQMMVVGMIGFLGNIKGVIYIYVDEATSISITSSFLGMDKKDLINNHETVNDALGELSNMISGTFKNQLCDKGYNCRLTIPSILRANNFTIEPLPGALHRMYQFEIFDSAMGLELVMLEGE